MLADRVAILSAGRVSALGTPQFIKKRFGVGYRLSVEANSRKALTEVERLVQEHCPDSFPRFDREMVAVYALPFNVPRLAGLLLGLERL